jgi:hypothetical protein
MLERRRLQMFMIPASEVFLVGAAVVLVLASLQSPICGTWLHAPRFTTPEGGITDEQMAHHPTLTRNFRNRSRQVSARRTTSPSPASAVWALATLAILGLLTTMLMMGIAISV